MPTAAETTPPTTRPPTREVLLRKRRGWFFGLTGEQFAKLVFQGNAVVSIVVLALITFTIFRDAVGFIPQNRQNLAVYRLAGLELVDLLRQQVTDHSTMSRYLSALRQAEFQRLTRDGQLAAAAANQQLAALDDFANRFAETIAEHETMLGNMTDLVSSIKERAKVAEDLTEAKQNLLGGIPAASAEQAALLKREAEAMVIEVIDFKAEIKPLLALVPEVVAANGRLTAELTALAAAPPAVNPAVLEKLGKFQQFVGTYLNKISPTEQAMQAWDQGKPIGVWESFNAFAFGRQWVTASFWQDWYGVIPLFTGSLLIACMALLLAIPLGVAAAIYVSQVARPIEQGFIKPYIEFIAAIPSVVLGFFGIAMLGETLRAWSQSALTLPNWLQGIPLITSIFQQPVNLANWVAHYVPGFPMLERLNPSTAACLLALMAIPTIFSLAEDAINNVPRSFREASLALGATRLQTIIRITVPAALSGIMAAILLGFGRVMGETMVVLLCAGNRIEIPDLSRGLGVVFQPVHTMTGIIAQEMGEVVRNSIHYRALFMVGALLFLISLLINWLAQKIVRRYRIVAT